MPNHRKSNETHRLHGTFRADRHGGGPSWPVDESVDPNVIPESYNWLVHQKHAVEFWRRVAPVLHSYGLLTQLDLTAFSIMAHVYGEWRELSEQVDAEGYSIEYRRGVHTVVKPNPKAAMLRKVERMLFGLMEQFGMSPRSRRSLGVEIQRPEADKLDKFLDKSKYFK